MQFIQGDIGSKSIKAWVDKVSVEEKALEQLKNTARMPFIYHHVAAMPDVHWGMGATVGSVVATRGAIIPAAVGVDIDCGMLAYCSNLNSSDLPDNLEELEQYTPTPSHQDFGDADEFIRWLYGGNQ
jgi:tRNA-splicing ligase RtcB